jgi:transketolase
MLGATAMNISDLKSKHPTHWKNAAAIRILAADAVHAAASGHQGMPIGMADVATVLYQNHLKFDASNPDWADRDRFILSAGHGSMLIYALLHLTGYEDMTIDEIKNFRQWGAKTAGHPEYGHAKGIETTTGPLGQGISNAVGFAMAEQSLQARFGKKVVDHYTYVIAGDGCLMEGVSQEAIGLAGKQRLGKLIVMWDDNNISIDGEIGISDVTDQRKRFEAAGWSVFSVDGHDPEAIDRAISEAKKSPQPSMIACTTRIALGVEGVENTAGGHGYNIKDDQLEQMREFYDWPYPAYEIPADVKSNWETIGSKGAADRLEWEGRLATLSGTKQAEFERVMNLDVPKKLSAAIKRLKKEISETAPKMATRKSSQTALEVINPIMTETIGGSADLTGSNNTITKGMTWFDADNRGGRHVAYGIREHGMAAAMNGMVLHGGVRPYGGTFMCFTDYARPSMRLAALMQVPVVYVYTHDSIGLGEDGPTHQPVEHLAISRATPNTWVFRPADTVETAEAWELAVTTKKTPSVLSLTRQGLRTVRTKHTNKNMVSMGAYVLAEAENKRKVILIATGSEVEIAMDAKAILEAEGIGTRVVSMPCMELFAEQDEAYRRKVLPAGPVRVGVEAAVQQGWDRWLTGERGKHNKAAFVGMSSFGASAPADELYEKFGITADNVAKQAKDLL